MEKRFTRILSSIAAFAIIGMLSAVLLASRAGGYFLMAMLEAPISPLTSPGNSQAQAIVVMGGGVEREFYGAQLQRETELPLLFSGAGNEQRVRKIAHSLKVPDGWIEDSSQNTEENAKFSASILERHQIQQIIVVTNAYHMLRAKLMFEHLGFAVIPAPVASVEPDPLGIHDFIPSREG